MYSLIHLCKRYQQYEKSIALTTGWRSRNMADYFLTVKILAQPILQKIKQKMAKSILSSPIGDLYQDECAIYLTCE